MKKIIKTVLTAALIAGSTSVFAQKLGCINMQELIFAMPETAEMQKNLEAYQKELQDHCYPKAQKAVCISVSQEPNTVFLLQFPHILYRQADREVPSASSL